MVYSERHHGDVRSSSSFIDRMDCLETEFLQWRQLLVKLSREEVSIVGVKKWQLLVFHSCHHLDCSESVELPFKVLALTLESWKIIVVRVGVKTMINSI
jgi:hypothetical protein